MLLVWATDMNDKTNYTRTQNLLVLNLELEVCITRGCPAGTAGPDQISC